MGMSICPQFKEGSMDLLPEEAKRRGTKSGLHLSAEGTMVGTKNAGAEISLCPEAIFTCLQSTRRGMSWLVDRPDFYYYYETRDANPYHLEEKVGGYRRACRIR